MRFTIVLFVLVGCTHHYSMQSAGQLSQGDTVTITDRAGVTQQARVTNNGGYVAYVGERGFVSGGDVVKVETTSHGLGALEGLGLGALAGGAVGYLALSGRDSCNDDANEICLNDAASKLGAIVGALAGGAVGALIGGATGAKQVYENPNVTFVGPAGSTVGMTVRF